MSKKVSTQIYLVLLFLFFSCTHDETLEKLDQIKVQGDTNPSLAIAMLDSLDMRVREESKYIKAKYDLLQIRLKDKADIVPTSDIVITRLVEYFDKHGSSLEKQEVYYYAGSVYRDLHDTPRSLSHFFQSLQYAKECTECDTATLRNTYSNLQYLYYRVQNYTDALSMAKQELVLCSQINDDLVLPYMHIGSSFVGLDSLKQAEKAFDSAFSIIKKSNDDSAYQAALILLLCQYADFSCMNKARQVKARILTDPLYEYDAFSCIAFAQYYKSLGIEDSSVIYCRRVLDKHQDLYNMYDAAKLLYKIFNKQGDLEKANDYANIYMQLSDSIDFGERQTLAATVNNEYKYHLDQKKEQRLKEETEQYKNTLVGTLFVIFILICLFYTYYIHKKNKHLRAFIQLTSDFQRATNEGEKLRLEICNKEEELASSRIELRKASQELDLVRQDLERVTKELHESGEALKSKELQLSDKIEQNKTFLNLLHQSELAGKAEDIIHTIRQSSNGLKEMRPADWKQFYQAVDEIYPHFKDRILQELGTFTEQQMQVCYLMRVGLSKPQIQNLTNLSRVTVWRWVKKYDWILLSPDKL